MDIKLLQTFKKINMQSAMKLHDTSKGLVPAPSTAAMHPSASGSNLRHESTFANVSQLLAAKFVLKKTRENSFGIMLSVFAFQSTGTNCTRSYVF